MTDDYGTESSPLFLLRICVYGGFSAHYKETNSMAHCRRIVTKYPMVEAAGAAAAMAAMEHVTKTDKQN